MINKLQHLMIGGFYTLLSVFCGLIAFATLDETYLSIGTFLAVLIISLIIHLFFIGKEIYLKTVSILFDVEDGNNFYQNELKNFRNVIDGYAGIIDSLITDQEKFETNFLQLQKKYDSFINDIKADIEKLEKTAPHNKIIVSDKFVSENRQDNNHRQSETLNMSPSVSPLMVTDNYQSSPEDNMIKVRSYLNPQSSSLPSGNHNKNIYPQHSTPSSQMKKNIPYISEEEFFDDDKSFSQLQQPTTSSPSQLNQENVPLSSRRPMKIETLDEDDEFAVIDPHIASEYEKISLENEDEEAFSESRDAYFGNQIRKELSEQSQQARQPAPIISPSIQNKQTYELQSAKNQPQMPDLDDEKPYQFDDDSFVDVTNHIKDHKENTTQNKYPENHTQTDSEFQKDNHIAEILEENEESFDIPSLSQQPHETLLEQSQPKEKISAIPLEKAIKETEIPSFKVLVPEEQLKTIASRKSNLLDKLSVPSLDSLLLQNNKQSKTPSPLQPAFHLPENFQSDENTKNFILKIRKALETNTIDLFIRPITDTLEREVKYFEAHQYLREEDNSLISPDKYMAIARQEGMGIAVDRLSIIRSLQLIRVIKQSIEGASIFCNISMSSLFDTHFEQELIDIVNERNSNTESLIFEFSQEQLGLLNSTKIQKLMDFHRIGLRFSLDNIYGALPNLHELSSIGFDFIKIQPEIMMNGLNCGGEIFTQKEIKTACQKANIKLCVTNINDHANLLMAVENGADLLEGDLLGELERSDKIAVTV